MELVGELADPQAVLRDAVDDCVGRRDGNAVRSDTPEGRLPERCARGLVESPGIPRAEDAVSGQSRSGGCSGLQEIASGLHESSPLAGHAATGRIRMSGGPCSWACSCNVFARAQNGESVPSLLAPAAMPRTAPGEWARLNFKRQSIRGRPRFAAIRMSAPELWSPRQVQTSPRRRVAPLHTSRRQADGCRIIGKDCVCLRLLQRARARFTRG